jgi:hypothetical protein
LDFARRFNPMMPGVIGRRGDVALDAAEDHAVRAAGRPGLGRGEGRIA